jgi:lipopolysaccharide/colanic/teichoic acid biosynthesis glycosyltransferase
MASGEQGKFGSFGQDKASNGMKGFVPKSGRPTKGGSLSRTAGAQGLLHYFFRQMSSIGNERGKRGSDKNVDFRVNTNELHVDAGSGLRPTVGPFRNGEASSNHDCPPFFQKIIEELVSPKRAVRPSPESEINGRPSHWPSGNGAIAAAIFPSDDAAEVSAARAPRWKRILDVTCIVLSSPFWLPVMTLVMGLVRLTSPGPIFYRQERVGYRRTPFMLFKFRTMCVNAETRGHEEYFADLMRSECPMTKLDAVGDIRLIPGGRFLRASGLDELPQIFNVLRGEMSLVGPRPCLPAEFERYQPSEQQRVNALPGLSGYWQVNGKNNTSFKEMIAMDLFYIRKMSIWLDLTIMFRTIPTLIKEVLNRPRTSRDRPPPNPAYYPRRVAGGSNGVANKI